MTARWRRSRGGASPAGRHLPCSAELDNGDEHIRALLAEVRELRLTLTADLTAAASALDVGAPGVARDIVEGDREELAALGHRTDARLALLQRLVVPTPDAPRWRRRALVALPAAPLVGAMAVAAAAATGALPLPGPQHGGNRSGVVQLTTSPVTSSFHRFESLIDGDPSASQVVAAAAVLHEEIAALIASAPDNPTKAREIAQLLQLEQDLLIRKQPPGARIVLAASRELVAQLLGIAPSAVPSSLRASPQLPSPATSTQPSAKTTSAPAQPNTWPSKHATSTPSPAHSPAPSPTSAANSTPAATPTPQLPHVGDGDGDVIGG